MMKLVVLSCVLAAAAGGLIAPLAYTAPFAYTSPLWAPYNYNYRGPLSLAPGQPANILGSDGRPLDTLDVNLDRSAHLTAKALAGTGVHYLKKRSASLIAPIALTHGAVAHAPLAYSAYSAPLAYSAPVLSTHYAAPIAYSHTPLAHW